MNKGGMSSIINENMLTVLVENLRVTVAKGYGVFFETL